MRSFVLILVAASLLLSAPNLQANGSGNADPVRVEAPSPPQVPIKKKSNSAVESKDKTDQKPEATNNPSAAIPESESPNTKAESSQYTSKGTEDSADPTEFFIVGSYKFRITDALLAVFTFLLVIVGVFQVHGLNQTNILTARLQALTQTIERAHVGISDLQTDFGHVTPMIRIKLKNTGKLPTENVFVAGRVMRRTDERPEIHTDLFQIPLGDTQIFPGDTIFLNEIGLGNFQSSEITDLDGGIETIFLNGQIFYRDGFGERQVTVFNYRYTARQWQMWPFQVVQATP